MVHIPKAAPVVEAKNVPNKVADLETRIHKLESELENQKRIFNEQAQLFVSAIGKTGNIAKAVRAMLIKLGAEVPQEIDEASEFNVPTWSGSPDPNAKSAILALGTGSQD